MSRRILRALRVPRRGEAGQSLVEFAIVLPILLALVIGIFEFGRAWNVHQVLTNAAREGARMAVVANGISAGSEEGVRGAVNAYMDNAALSSTGRTITITGFNSGTGNPVTVRVQYAYEFQFLGPIVGFLGDGAGDGVPGAITLSSSAVMRNE